MKFFTKFNPFKDDGTSFDGVPSQTQTQFADQCDLKFMLARLQRGDVSVLKSTGLFYADVTTLPADLQSALNGQLIARNAWNENPALQKRFVAPENLLDFLADDNNRAEAISLGLIDAPVEDVPLKVEIANPAAAATVTPGGAAAD